MKRTTLAICATLALSTSALAQEATREIQNVTGDVYRFQNNFHFALVVPTTEGTVVVDPINADASGWLKDNLNQITDQPVTHLIYSHSHGDHASGGAVFEGAHVIAHENAPAEIDGVAPTERIGDTHSFDLGGKTFELTHLGPGHGEDMIAVVVRPENVAFIVDVAAPERLPWQNFGGANIDDWAKQIEMAESLDFEVFAPGHGRVGTHEEVGATREYIEALREAVLSGLKDGKSIDELKAEVKMDDYAGWSQYDDWRPMNVEGMADYLTKAGLVN
ncbi:2,4-dinitroanisole O-demethylase subunit alpha [Defluviimonas aquaemixtae]|uniref:2,4-dinitroanisole O-demethylase subunit alpha n=1 Tax=Albidovulum aquaemixtae TaxID=1542388 RepID=A0A2R8B2Y2_9RHOB|nr:MBL fold metallo-hydrolase [Defluviimonas aquaemixtae]SPH17009.1 2,4-dinitroanisole O-demethylase subunit alpha [Defluviimonas aquaemixtae]